MEKNNKVISKFTILEKSSHKYFAQLFVKLRANKGKLNYIYSKKLGWLEYNKYNVIDVTGNEPLRLNLDISRVLGSYLDKLLSKVDLEDKNYKYCKKLYNRTHKDIENNTFKKRVIEELKGLLIKDKIEEKLDANNKLLAFKDKVYDFELLKFRDIRKEDYISTTTGYKVPERNDKIQTDIKKIISSIFECEEMETYILDIFGYSLFTNEFEILHILSGRGGNGKGLISEIVKNAMGGYYYTTDSKFLTCKYKAQGFNEDLANARGKKMLMTTEPQSEKETVNFNQDFLKMITGERTINCRAIFEKSIEFKPIFTQFIQCNEMPRLEKMEDAIKRRIKCVRFPFSFVENPKYSFQRKIDYTLKNKMGDKKYYTQFMLLLINHIKPKTKEKIKFPEKVDEETNAYFESNNVISTFIETQLIVTNNPKDRIKCSEVYLRFKEDENFQYMDRNKFKYNMIQNNMSQKKYQGYPHWYGVKFKESDDEEEKESSDIWIGQENISSPKSSSDTLNTEKKLDNGLQKLFV